MNNSTSSADDYWVESCTPKLRLDVSKTDWE